MFRPLLWPIPGALLAITVLWNAAGAQDGIPSTPESMSDPGYRATFSIVARDAETGELGHAEASKALAGGTNFGAARGGVGVITNQASTFIMYGKFGIQMLEMGFSPEEALAFLLRADEDRERRQVAIIDMEGRTAAFTGSVPRDWKGHRCGVDYCVQGNSLTGPEVLEAMARSFEGSGGSLAERLMEAVEAGEAAGGDRRGKQEAYLLVVRRGASSGGFSDKVVEIRVDDHPDPVTEARRILNRSRSGGIIQEGNRRLAEGDPEGALRSYHAATELSPENDNAWVAVARARVARGEAPEALAALRRAVELNPGNRGLLPEEPAFESLREDPAFRDLTTPREPG
jgi:uncharacterized Ntn-hydrolase superfamily protein